MAAVDVLDRDGRSQLVEWSTLELTHVEAFLAGAGSEHARCVWR
jgi:hypothetical protein